MEKIYYYTDFETFKLILQNGTLRFKESTSSNDKLDSIKIYNALEEIANNKLNSEELKKEQRFYFELVKYNGSHSPRLYLVACFTELSDSRMLWDAYTMHRKDRESTRYNGVCIEFDKHELENIIVNCDFGFDLKCINRISYGFDDIDSQLEEEFSTYSKKVELLSKDDDQHQSIIKPISVFNMIITLKKCIVYPTLELMDRIERKAPFLKASFWREEKEVRALLSTKRIGEVADKLCKYEDGSCYYDLQITKNCISKIILGPEFSEEDKDELLKLDAKIHFGDLNIMPSEGTGIITNK